MDFIKRSGIADGSVVAHQHRTLSDAARMMMSFDQYDLTISASGELVIRSLVRLETAVGRNPKAPDFSGLDLMLLSTVTESGGAVTADRPRRLLLGLTLQQFEDVFEQARIAVVLVVFSVIYNAVEDGLLPRRSIDTARQAACSVRWHD